MSDFQKLHMPHMFVTAIIVSCVLLFQVQIFFVRGLPLSHPRDCWECWGMVIDAWMNVADVPRGRELGGGGGAIRFKICQNQSS